MVSIGALAAPRPAGAFSTPHWQPAQAEAPQAGWQVVTPDMLTPAEPAAPSPQRKAELAATARDYQKPRQPPVILGAGGGLRVGLGEPTYGMAYGRLGVPIGDQLGVSLRPGYVFGNSDRRGRSNGQGAWHVPITLDLLPRSGASPYVGAGVSTNTDSSGDSNALITTGIDIHMTRHLSLGLALNYIVQPDDNNGRDFEAMSVLYLRY
ncbi:MAG: hypothetical protein VKN13_07050 [Cyanobacteriota bacterium]|nr:hypothetical protein [Cyanobacteriota bacterium]